MASATNSLKRVVTYNGSVTLNLSMIEAIFLKELLSDTTGDIGSAEPISVEIWGALNRANVPSTSLGILDDIDYIELASDSMQVINQTATDMLDKE